jgi:hypothetical protein
MRGGKGGVEVAGFLVVKAVEERGAGGVEVFALEADGAGTIAGPALAGRVAERALVKVRAADGGGRGGKLW